MFTWSLIQEWSGRVFLRCFIKQMVFWSTLPELRAHFKTPPPPPPYSFFFFLQDVPHCPATTISGGDIARELATIHRYCHTNLPAIRKKQDEAKAVSILLLSVSVVSRVNHQSRRNNVGIRPMGPVHNTWWYPKFNGSHFVLPPSSI